MAVDVELPPLANFANIGSYQPNFGDIIIWSGWFSCWFGIVSEYNRKQSTVNIIFHGLPILLLTMDSTRHQNNTKTLALNKIRNSRPGTFAALQHDQARNINTWYI